MAASGHGRGLSILRIFLGVFFLFEAIGKIGWFADSAALTRQLSGWLETAGPWNRWYLEHVCLPGAAVLARVVPIGEASAAAALLLGAYVRPAAVLALVMVLNFHFASGAMFRYSFLTNGYGLPVIGGLLALAIGGSSLPFSLKK
jgi:uncharacterized membrane protein YphA (DoxX/SURF4 family)